MLRLRKGKNAYETDRKPTENRQIKQQGLYDKSFEHDNCGIGAVVNVNGKTGDGVGILTQIPHRFFKKECEKLGIRIGEEREYGVGMFFFPQKMIPVEGTEEVLPADLVLIAAGFQGCETYIPESFSVEIDERTNIKTDPKSYKTNVDQVLTAGDMHRGQSLVVWAIAEGRNAAKEVDESLMGYTNL